MWFDAASDADFDAADDATSSAGACSPSTSSNQHERLKRKSMNRDQIAPLTAILLFSSLFPLFFSALSVSPSPNAKFRFSIFEFPSHSTPLFAPTVSHSTYDNPLRPLAEAPKAPTVRPRTAAGPEWARPEWATKPSEDGVEVEVVTPPTTPKTTPSVTPEWTTAGGGPGCNYAE